MTRTPAGLPLSTARLRVLRIVSGLAESGPVTHHEVSAAAGGHPNTARQHLDALVAAGFLDAEPLLRPGPGRRPFGFTPTARGRKLASGSPASAPESSELVGAFAAYLVRQDDPAGAAREVGDIWGRREAAGLRGGEPVDALIEVLDMLGFTPERTECPEGSVVVLRTCSLLDASRPDDRTVMCDLHRGMIEGVVTSLGGRQGVLLEPLPTHQGCRVVVTGGRSTTECFSTQ